MIEQDGLHILREQAQIFESEYDQEPVFELKVRYPITTGDNKVGSAGYVCPKISSECRDLAILNLRTNLKI